MGSIAIAFGLVEEEDKVEEDEDDDDDDDDEEISVNNFCCESGISLKRLGEEVEEVGRGAGRVETAVEEDGAAEGGADDKEGAASKEEVLRAMREFSNIMLGSRWSKIMGMIF